MGHPKRDGSIIIWSCEARQRSVWPIGSTTAVMNHTRCPYYVIGASSMEWRFPEDKVTHAASGQGTTL